MPGRRAHSPLLNRSIASEPSARIHIKSCAADNTPYSRKNSTTHHAVCVFRNPGKEGPAGGCTSGAEDILSSWGKCGASLPLHSSATGTALHIPIGPSPEILDNEASTPCCYPDAINSF